MAANSRVESSEPKREEIDMLVGPTVLEFGTDWCGFCRAAQPLIAEAFAGHSATRHLKVEDGKGRLLGRSFQIKLWPTLIFLDHGKEVARIVRPRDTQAIASALQQLDRSRVE